eukprot:1136389-Pelagomonas_calceolata.AAC.3
METKESIWRVNSGGDIVGCGKVGRPFFNLRTVSGLAWGPPFAHVLRVQYTLLQYEVPPLMPPAPSILSQEEALVARRRHVLRVAPEQWFRCRHCTSASFGRIGRPLLAEKLLAVAP